MVSFLLAALSLIDSLAGAFRGTGSLRKPEDSLADRVYQSKYSLASARTHRQVPHAFPLVPLGNCFEILRGIYGPQLLLALQSFGTLPSRPGPRSGAAVQKLCHSVSFLGWENATP